MRRQTILGVLSERAKLVGALVVAAAGGLAVGNAIGADDESPSSQAIRLHIDEQAGGVGGVRLGDNARAVGRAFGHSRVYGEYAPITPLGVAGQDLTHPAPFDCKGDGEDTTLRYVGASFMLRGGRVCVIEVTAGNARTGDGVGPGNDLDRLKTLRAGNINCGDTDIGGDRPIISRACWKSGNPGVYLWFGGDPIDSITIANGRLGPSSPSSAGRSLFDGR